MKCASDFRRIARDALSGRWLTALIAGLVAALLGGVTTSQPSLNLNLNHSDSNPTIELGGQTIDPQISEFLVGFLAVFVIVAIAVAALYVVLGSVVQLGYCRFNLDLVDRRKEPELNSLFSYFPRWRTAVAASLLQTLYILAWSLLLIIPGIVASYSYAMTPYILAEHPEMTAGDAIEYSKAMMSGNRWRFFCLGFSFIGWNLLSILTLGIGNLWLRPYQQAAFAAFYREVSGTENRGAVADAGL